MNKAEILKKINEAVEVKSSLDKKIKELSASQVEIKKLTDSNDELHNYNELLESKINELNSDISILNDSKNSEELLKNKLYESLVSSNKKIKKYSYFLVLTLATIFILFIFSVYLYFSSDRMPENKKSKLNSNIYSEENKKNNVEKKLSNSLEAIKALREEYNTLRENYDTGENCSRIPFIK